MTNRLRKMAAGISGFIASQPVFVRSIYAESLLEDFFVAAVGAVLAIRLYLATTGYGQLTFGPLHIAHLLWGGLFMLVAMVILLASITHRGQVVAALVGGIGFGAFIDELGKFVTRDNNYFFQPAVAVIYVVFVVLFLATRFIARERQFTPEQNLANALQIAMHGSLAGLHAEQQEEALELLEASPPGPLRDNVKEIVQGLSVQSHPRLRVLEAAHTLFDRVYLKATTTPWFGRVIVAFFALTSVTSLSGVIAVVDWSLGLALWVGAGVALLVVLVSSVRSRLRYLNIALSVAIVIVSTLLGWAMLGNLKRDQLSFSDYAQFLLPAVTGVIVVMGMLTLPRSRLHAYLLFRLAILVSIFLTQVFAFYQQQFVALLGLLLDILILIALRYLIRHEHERIRVRSENKNGDV